MAKQRSISTASIFQSLFQAGLYKSSQGRVTRQVTFATLAVAFALAAWRMHATLNVSPLVRDWLEWAWGGTRPGWLHALVSYGAPLTLLAAGLWISYRVVNYPRFADFLVAVEAEMNKVSWPSRAELFRSSLVVILVIFILAGVLFGYDLLWRFLFEKFFRILQQ